MNLSAAGFDLIRKWEGWVPYLYDDAANNATVGFGILVHEGPTHAQRGVCAECDQWPRQSEQGQWLTEEQGRELLDQKVHATGRFAGGQDYAGAVGASCPGANANQFAAFVDFAYNLGSGLDAGEPLAELAAAFTGGGDVCATLRRFVHAKVNGVMVTLPGLVSRREDECVLFNTPTEEHRMYSDTDIDAKVGALFGQLGKLGADVRTLTGDIQGTFRYAYDHISGAPGLLAEQTAADLRAKIDELQQRLDAGAADLRQAADALGK